MREFKKTASLTDGVEIVIGDLGFAIELDQGGMAET